MLPDDGWDVGHILMRQGIRIIIGSFILALLFGSAHDACASAAKKRVLVLYAEGKDLPAHEMVDRGIRGGQGVVIFFGMAKPVRAPQIGPARPY